MNKTTIELKEEIISLQKQLQWEKQKNVYLLQLSECGLIFLCNRKIIQANRYISLLTEYPVEELEGMDIKKLLTKASYEKLAAEPPSPQNLVKLEFIQSKGEPIEISARWINEKVNGNHNQILSIRKTDNLPAFKGASENIENQHELISGLLSDYVYSCHITPNQAPVINWVSGSIYNVSGYTIEEVEQQPQGWFSIIHPKDVSRIANTVFENYGENKIYENEYRIIDKEGKIRWLQDKSICVHFNKNSREITLLGATKDITTQKRFEEKLKKKNKKHERLNLKLKQNNTKLIELNAQVKESEEKYRDLTEALEVGVVITNARKVVYVNKSALRILEVKSREDILGRESTEFLTSSSSEEVNRRLQRLAKNQPIEINYRLDIRLSDKKKRTVDVMTYDMMFQGKKCRQSIIKDVTPFLEAEKKLKRSSDIIKNMQIGLFIYRLDNPDDDTSLRMVAVNPAACKLVGLSEKELIGEKIDILFPGLRKKKIPQQYAEVIKTQIPVELDDVYYDDRRISALTFSVKVFPLPDQCVGVSFENVSERRKAENELRNKNQELNDFIYKVSHDLRAPLNSIKGLIHLSKLENSDIDHLSKIEDRIAHLDGFIRDILSHSRNLNTAIVIEQVNVKQIIDECLTELDHLPHAADTAINIQVEGENFFSDKIRITEIFRNMMSNALKYQNPARPDKQLNISVHISRKEAVIHFDDNGIGIDNEYLNHIFEMFFRATSKVDGTGVGLYIVKKAVEKLAGRVNVTSTIGEGTKFTIVLPNFIAIQKKKQT